MSKNTVRSIGLSTIKIDFDDLRTQLQRKLATSDAWTDLNDSSTGQTIIDMIAAFGALSQFSIESALQETTLPTAKFDSTIMEIARTLGTRLSRKNPAHATFRISRPTSTGDLTIPAYSEFVYGSMVFYNRNQIYFANGVNYAEAVLYKGVPRAVLTSGNGTPFQRFISDERDFTIADSDVTVFANGRAITVTQDGLYHATYSEAVVQDRTTKEGRLILTFGNDYYGYCPQVNDNISIRYVVTDGAAGNDTAFAGTEVSYSDNNDIKGEALTALSGGANEPDVDVYRYISPYIYSGGDKAITDDQYNAVAFTYPGVIDALIQGQRDIAPFNKNWMNVARCTLLTETEWDDTDWANFKEWFEKKSLTNVDLIQGIPRPREFSVAVSVACKNTVMDLNEMQTLCYQAIDEFLQPKYGSLGSRVFISDLYEVVRSVARDDISHVNIDTPKVDVISSFVLYNLTAVPSITSSKLVPGNYQYTVTIVAERDEETLEITEESLGVTIACTTYESYPSVKLEWTPHPNALSYRIYGRVEGSLGLIGEVLEPSFEDTGNNDPDMRNKAPTVDTLGVYYPKCTDIKVSVYYDSGNRGKAGF